MSHYPRSLESEVKKPQLFWGKLDEGSAHLLSLAALSSPTLTRVRSSKAGTLRVTPEGDLKLVGDGGVLGKGNNSNSQQEQKQKFFATRSADGKWNLLMAPTSDPSRLFLVQPAPGHNYKFQMTEGGQRIESINTSAEKNFFHMSSSNGCEDEQSSPVSTTESAEQSPGISKSIAVPVAQLRASSSVSPLSSSHTTTATSPTNVGTKTTTAADAARPCNTQKPKKPTFFKSRSASDREALKASAAHVFTKVPSMSRKGSKSTGSMQTGHNSKQGKKGKSAVKSAKKTSVSSGSLQEISCLNTPVTISFSSADTPLTVSDSVNTVSPLSMLSTSVTVSSPASSVSSSSHVTPTSDPQLHRSPSSPLGHNSSELSAATNPRSTASPLTLTPPPTDTLRSSSSTSDAVFQATVTEDSDMSTVKEQQSKVLNEDTIPSTSDCVAEDGADISVSSEQVSTHKDTDTKSSEADGCSKDGIRTSQETGGVADTISSEIHSLSQRAELQQTCSSIDDCKTDGDSHPVTGFDSAGIDGNRNENTSGQFISTSVPNDVLTSDKPCVCFAPLSADEEEFAANENVNKDSNYSAQINKHAEENKVTDGHTPENSEEAETSVWGTSKDYSKRRVLRPLEKGNSDSSSDTDDYEFDVSDTEKENETEEPQWDVVAHNDVITEESQKDPIAEGDFVATEESKKDPITESVFAFTAEFPKDPTAGDFISAEESQQDPIVQDVSFTETEKELNIYSSDKASKDADSVTLSLSNGETNLGQKCSEQQSASEREKDHIENFAELVNDNVDKASQDQSKTEDVDSSDLGATVNSETASTSNSHTIESKDSLDHNTVDEERETTNEACMIGKLFAEFSGITSSVDSETPAPESAQDVQENVDALNPWTTVSAEQCKPKKRKKRKSELDVLIEPSSHDSETLAFESFGQFRSNNDLGCLELMHSKPKKRKKRKSELENLIEKRNAESDKAEQPAEVEEQIISQEPEPVVGTQPVSDSARQDAVTSEKKQKKKKKQKLKILISLGESKSTGNSRCEHAGDHVIMPPTNRSHATGHASSSSVLQSGPQEEENLSKSESEKLRKLPEENTAALSNNDVENQDSVTAGVLKQNEEITTESQTAAGTAEKTKKKKKKKSKKLKIIFGSGQETSTRDIPVSESPEYCSLNDLGMEIQSDKSVADVQNLAEPAPVNGEQSVVPVGLQQKKKRKKRLSELETLIHDQEVHARYINKQDAVHENDTLDTIEELSEQTIDQERDNLQHDLEATPSDTSKEVDHCEGNGTDKDESSRMATGLDSEKVEDSSVPPAADSVAAGLQPKKDALHSVKSKIKKLKKKKKKKKTLPAVDTLIMPPAKSGTDMDSTVSHCVEEDPRKSADIDSSLTTDTPLSSVPHGVTAENVTNVPASSSVQTMDSAPSEQPRDDALHSVKRKTEKPKKKKKRKKKETTAGVIVMPSVTSGTDAESIVTEGIEADSRKSVDLDRSVTTDAAVSDSLNDTNMDLGEEEEQEEEANANKAMAKFLTSRSFSKGELTRLFGIPFVVLERLSDHDIYFMSRRFRNARVSGRARCSDHCRLRTLTYLCRLNLIDCRPLQDPSQTVSGLQGDTDTEGGSPRKKKRKRKQNKEGDEKEGEPKKKKKKKKEQANDKDGVGGADDVVLVDTPQTTVPTTSPQEIRNLSSSVTTLQSFPSASFGRIRMAQPTSIIVASPNPNTTSTVPRFITVPPLATNRTSSGPQVITIPSFGGLSRPSGLPQLLTIPPLRATVNPTAKIIIPALSATGPPSSLKDATRASLTQAISNSLCKTRLVTPMSAPPVAVTPPMTSVSASVLPKGPIVVQASMASTTASTTQSSNTAPKFFMMQVGNKQVLVPVSALSMTTPTTAAALSSSAAAATASTAPVRPSLQSLIGPVGVQRAAGSIPTIISAPATGIRPSNPTSLIPGSMARIVLSNRRPASLTPRTGPTVTTVATRTGPTASTLLFANRPAARPNQPWTGPRTVDSNRRVMVTPASQPQGIRVVLSGAGPVSSGARFTVSTSRGGVFVASRQPPTLLRTPAPRQPRPGKRIMTDEERLRKRARLEKKYPLPPGVVIKTEPVSRGYSDEGKTTQASSSSATRVYVSTVPVASGARTQVNLAQPIPVLSAIRGSPIVIRQAQPVSSSTPRPSLLTPLIIRMPNATMNTSLASTNLASTPPATATRVVPTVTASSLLTSMIRSAQTTNSAIPLTYSLLSGASTATVTVSSDRVAVTSSIPSMSFLSSQTSAVLASSFSPAQVASVSSTAATGDLQRIPNSQQNNNEEEDAIYIADSPLSVVQACEAENTQCSHSDNNSVNASPVEITSAVSTVSGGTLSAAHSPCPSVTTSSFLTSSAAASPAATTVTCASPSPIMSSAPSSPMPSTSASAPSSRMASLGAMWVRQAAESPSNIPSINTRSLQSDRMRRLKETLAKQMESLTDERRQKGLQYLQHFFQVQSSAGNISGGNSSQLITDSVHMASECSEDSNASSSNLQLIESAAEAEEGRRKDHDGGNVSLPAEEDCSASDSRDNLVAADSGEEREAGESCLMGDERTDSGSVGQDGVDQETVSQEDYGGGVGQDGVDQETVSQEDYSGGVGQKDIYQEAVPQEDLQTATSGNDAAVCEATGGLSENNAASDGHQSSTGPEKDSEEMDHENDSTVNRVLVSCGEGPSRETSTENHADSNISDEKDGSGINNAAGDTTDDSCVTSSADKGDGDTDSQVTADSEMDHSGAKKDTGENETTNIETNSGEDSSVLPLVDSEVPLGL